MKIYSVLGFTFLLCACGSDGGSNNVRAIPDPSSPVYDYRNYIDNPNEEADIDGFWMVFARQQFQAEDKSILNTEYAYLVSLHQLNDESIEIFAPTSIFGQPSLQIDSTADGSISWQPPHSPSNFTFYFTGKKIMAGKFIKEANVRNYDLYAVKLADFPDGKLPNEIGMIELDSSLFGTMGFDVISSPEFSDENFNLSISGFINMFSRMHLTLTNIPDFNNVIVNHEFTCASTFDNNQAHSLCVQEYKFTNEENSSIQCDYIGQLASSINTPDEVEILSALIQNPTCEEASAPFNISNNTSANFTANIIDVLGINAEDDIEDPLNKRYLLNGNISLDLAQYLTAD